MQDFHKLDVWHKSHALALATDRNTESFPRDEAFGLVTQLRRAATSIPLRIADACGKDRGPDFEKCLLQARGTGVELEYLLLLSRDLGFLKTHHHDPLVDQLIEVRRMLSGLIKSTAL